MSKQTYKEYQAEVKEEQKDKSYSDIKEAMTQKNEFLVELDKLKPQEHFWVDRGVVMSCEGALHANHRVFKRSR